MAFPDDLLDLFFEAEIDGVWTDLTDRLMAESIEITWGRSDEFSQVSPATATARLVNDDGKLTPGHPGSAWYPFVDRDMPVRIWASGYLLVGTASSVDPTFPVGDLADGDDAVVFVTITASGILRQRGQRDKPIRSAIYRQVTSAVNLPHVFDYFPMEDGATASRIASGLPDKTRQTMSFTGLQLSSDSTLEGSEALPTAQSGTRATWLARHITGFSAQGVVEAFCHYSERPTDPATIFRPIDITTTGDLARWLVEVRVVGTDQVLRLRTFNAAGVETNISVAFLDVSTVFFTPAPIQIRLELNDSGGSVAWTLSWWTVTREVDPGEFMTGTFTGSFGTIKTLGGQVDHSPSGAVGHLILHDGIAAGWLVGPDVAWFGEAVTDRVQRLCGEESIPLEVVTGDDMRCMPMGTQRPGKLLDLLQECAAAEFGILSEQRDAWGLRWRPRRTRYNCDPVLTLDAALSQIANPFEPTRDDQAVRNDVTAQRTSGSSARVTSGDLVVYDESETYNVAVDSWVRHLAGWLLHIGTAPGLRYPQVTFRLQDHPELIDVWKTVNVGDIVRITNLPAQLPADTIDLVIEGAKETLSPTGWEVTLNCTPASIWTVGRWAMSRWGSRDSRLSGPVATTDPLIFVATPGHLWTTDPAHFPFDFMLGGERCTVLGITGTSSPQHWSVIRNVNGFARSHDVGTEIVLVDPALLGL